MGQRLLYLLGGTLLTLLLQIAAGSLGLAGVLVNLLVPLPAAVSHMRKGMIVGGGVVVFSGIALLPIAGFMGSAAYFLQFGLASFTLPLLLRRGWSWDRSVAGALGVIMAFSVLSLGGYAIYRKVPIAVKVQEYVQSELNQALALYQQGNLPQDQVEELRQVAERTADFLVKAYPGLAVMVTGAMLLFLVLCLSALPGKQNVLPGVPFPLWKVPESLIWVLILAGFGMFLADGTPQLVAMNLLTVLLPVYFLQGLAIVSYYFRKKGITPIFRTLGYLLVSVLSPFPLIVTGIGVFDLWADFRKPRIKKT